MIYILIWLLVIVQIAQGVYMYRKITNVIKPETPTPVEEPTSRSVFSILYGSK